MFCSMVKHDSHRQLSDPSPRSPILIEPNYPYRTKTSDTCIAHIRTSSSVVFLNVASSSLGTVVHICV